MTPHARVRGVDLGFRRVTLVRGWRDPDGVRYEVEGIAYRHPVTRRITARMARDLAAAGIPFVMRDRPC